MKTITLLTLVTFLIGTSSFLIKVPTAPTRPKIVPVGWVHLQKLVLPLFENVCEDSDNPTIVRLAQEFNLDLSIGIYLKPEVVANFRNLKSEKGLLGKGEIFTEYNIDHINELRALYEVFIYAKDFNTFYTAAAWARQNVNCGLFVDAIYLAILNRRDTEKLSVPAPYELLPNYFFKKDVIIEASMVLSGLQVELSDTVRDEGNAYILDTNYTANFYDNDHESKLAYFHEDVGLNTYYFLQKLRNAPWFNTPSDMNVRYGEYLYHLMKQLSTRYDLERYSNGFPETENINLNSLMVDVYEPMLIYSNGKEFGDRTISSELSDDNEIEFLQNIENNIATVVNHMRGSGYNKTQILNHLMEILVTGEKSYETVARKLIGKDSTSNIGQPSVMEHYMTSLRDPVFWKLNKKIMNLVDDSLKAIPGYTKSELYFPGIEILNIDVKKMMTSFDYFQIDVTDALKPSTSETTFDVKIGQPRLNHKPFAMKLNISSVVTQKGLVKIYLGPKVAPGEFSTKKNLFMLIDSFEYNFKTGTNVISRSSEDIINLSEDFKFLRTLRKNVEDAEFGLSALPLKPVETMTGFPSRLILPKGSPEGLPLQIFVFVAPFVKATLGGLYILPSIDFNTAVLSPGFPLDLDIDAQILGLPNAFLKDFIVTHKGDSKVLNYGTSGATKKWQNSGNYDASMRPDYSSKTKEPFDYSSKKGQYGKNEDFSAKIDNQYTNQDVNTDIDKILNSNTKSEDLNVNKNTNENNVSPKVLNYGSFGGTKKWQSGSNYDPSSRPDYSSKRKERFDYASKKGQYGKKQDYSAKRDGYYKDKQDTVTQNVNTDPVTEVNCDKKLENLNVNKGSNEDQYNKAKDNMINLTRDDDIIQSQYNAPLYEDVLQKQTQSTKRVPTVFDYILPKYSDEDYNTEENVYE